MTNESSTVRVPVFNGKNFGLWKRQIKVTLIAKSLADVLEPKEEGKQDAAWIKKDSEVQALMYSGMEQSVALKVSSCTSAAEIWARLLEVYENTSVAMVGKLLEEYHAYRKQPSDDMAMHISKVEALASHLETVGQPQTEISIMSRLLYSLPSSYDSFKDAWESVSPEQQTKSGLVSRMLSRDSSSGQEKPAEVALVAETERNRFRRKLPIKCYNCGQVGHMARNCRSRRQDSNRQDGIALVVGRELKSGHWIIDSGASNHTCCREEWFETLTPWSEKLQVGNKEWVEAVGRGTISIQAKIGSEMETIKLLNVLYIPAMSQNLLSTCRAAERGVKTLFDRYGCRMYLQGRVIAVGLAKTNGLCVLDAWSPASKLLMAAQDKTLPEWHRSMGHADTQAIAKMARDECAEGMNIVEPENDAVCQVCPEGKATRASHTSPSSFEPKTVGERVDMDLVGPINTPSLGGALYFLLLKDRYSGYSHIYCLNSKDEVPAKLRNYFAVFEVESNRRVRCLMTDNGSEFGNKQNHLTCDLEHVKFSFSAPYTPEQNGAAERNNRTIIETIRTLIADSELPKSIWAEAANTAVYLRNRVAIRSMNKTPYELFWGRKPYVGHLVPFGTQVHALITDRRLGKFDARTEAAFIIGYTERANTYRILVRDSLRVKVTCDVIFRNHAKHTELGQESHGTSFIDVNPGEDPRARSRRLLDEFFNEINNQANETGRQGETRSSTSMSKRAQDDDANPSQTKQKSDVPSPDFSSFTNASAFKSTTQGGLSRWPVMDLSQNARLTSTPKQQGDIPSLGSRALSPTHRSRSAAEEAPEIARVVPPQPNPSHSRNLSQEPTVDRQVVEGNGVKGVVTRAVAKKFGGLFYSESGMVEPQTYREAVTGRQSGDWKEAIERELQSLQKNATWEVVPRPEQDVALTAKWVFKIKRDGSGNIEKFKARLVARGFQQVEGRDFFETYAPVASTESIRIVLAVAISRRWAIERFDVSTAFLHGTLQEEVYLEAPDGVNVQPDEVLKLKKALYGLRQAPKEWNSTFNRAVESLGFACLKNDDCVYKHREKDCLVCLYVDDGIVVAKDRDLCLEVMRRLNQYFETNRIEGETFLGTTLQAVPGGLFLSQQRHISDLLSRFNMSNCTAVSRPLIDQQILFEEDGDTRADVPYRAAIGSMLYIAMSTRPDILYPTVLLSKFNERPQNKHWAAVKRVMRYLRGTPDVGLLFEPKSTELEIMAFCDADWAGDLSNRRSTTGVVITLASCPVIFVSRQQTSAAQSSTEAELIAAYEAVKELMWLTSFLEELGLKFPKPKLFIDNMSTIALITNSTTRRRRLKYIDVKYHLVRDQLREGLFELEHVGTRDQIADYLTKPIAGDQLMRLCHMSGVISRQHTLRGSVEDESNVSCRSGSIGTRYCDRGGRVCQTIPHERASANSHCI